MPPVEHSLSENGFTDTYLVARSGTELVVLMPLSYLENNSYYANPPPPPTTTVVTYYDRVTYDLAVFAHGCASPLLYFSRV